MIVKNLNNDNITKCSITEKNKDNIESLLL